MHIGELAERTGLSLRTIRHYDEIGLLPASTRSDGGFRIYTEADCARLLVIRSMKPLGFSLEQMAELLELVDSFSAGRADSAGRDLLARYIDETTAKRDKLALNLERADGFLADLRRLQD